MGSALWLWARREWRRHWTALVLLTAVVTIAGGAALGGLAASRRTGSAFDRLSSALHVADLTVSSDGDAGLDELDAHLIDRVAALDGVTGVSEYTFVGAAPAARPNFFSIAFSSQRGTSQTFVPLEGPALRSWADLGPDDVIVNEAMADALDLHAGDTLTVATEPLDQWMVTINGGEAGPPAGPVITARVVNVGRVLEDITDAPDPIMVVGPGFVATYRDQVGMCRCSLDVNVAPGQIDAVQSAIQEVAPGTAVGPVEDFGARIADTVSLQRHAWLLIALTAAIAGALGLAQAVLRLGRILSTDDRARSALGLSRNGQRLGRFLAMAPAAVAGAVGSVITAYFLSGLTPVGITRRAEPHPGRRWDVLVMGLGGVGVVVVAGAILAVVTVVQPSSAARWGHAGRPTGPVFGLGVRMTAGPGRGALLGVALGAAGVMGAATLDHSVDHLLATPSLYGADFDASVFLSDGADRDVAASTFAADHDFEAVAVVWTGTPGATDELLIDGPDGSAVVSPRAFDPVTGTIDVTITQGRAPGRPDEVALGRRLMHDLGVGVGDRITLNSPSGPTPLTIVSDNLDPGVDEAGRGFTMTLAGLRHVVDAVPQGIVTRFAAGADHDIVLARYAGEHLLPVEPPSEVGHVGQLGGLPGKVAWLLGLLGATAVANALVLTVRHSRRQIAIHRALGLTSRQVAGAYAWQATLTALVGLTVGIPAGFVAGRAIVHTLVDDVGAIPKAVWPSEFWALVLAVGALVLIGVVASGTATIRQRAGEVLRAE